MTEIHSEEDYRAALTEIEHLLALEGDAPGSAQVQALIEPIEAYEAEHYLSDEADPGR